MGWLEIQTSYPCGYENVELDGEQCVAKVATSRMNLLRNMVVLRRGRRSLTLLAGLFVLLPAWALLARESTGQRIIHAEKEPQNWLTTGLNYQETRFSPLDQVNKATVSKLGLAWSYDLDTHRGQESTPLAVDGVLYTTSAWSKVQAFDGVTGRLLWQFDPHVPGTTGAKACCDVINRGAAYWDGKVYVGTLDGRLIAIDAKSGKQVWSTLTVDQSKNYTITGAPRIVKGLVIIGNGGGEYDVRGYISAYNAETGKLVWRFYTVPGKPRHPDGVSSDNVLAEIASRTWSPDTWKLTDGAGGGTVWDSMAYDPHLDLLYFGIGNGDYWPQKYRSPSAPKGGNNDNLFLDSIIAVRPETGQYVWYYQEVPGDQWDYDSTQNMILANLNIHGRLRKVLLQAPKNGFFYVIDRTNGKVISAKPFTKVNWATGIDLKTGRPIVNPNSDYSKTGKTWFGMPGARGAHNWPPMSFNPNTGLVYIPIRETSFPYVLDRHFKPMAVGYDLGVNIGASPLPVDPKKLNEIRAKENGELIAWNPVTQKSVWRVQLATAAGGGTLTTAGGLVFEGGAAGIFHAYDTKDGRKLWSFDAHSAIMAAPITWSRNGRQYVTVLTGWGSTEGLGVGPIDWSKKGPRRNISRVLTFVLGGHAKLPPIQQEAHMRLDPPPQFGNAATIREGMKLYHRSCYGCHGPSAMSGGVLPDLRYSRTLGSKEAWDAILIDGILSSNGMVSFKNDYNTAQVEAIRAYVIRQAQRSKELGAQ